MGTGAKLKTAGIEEGRGVLGDKDEIRRATSSVIDKAIARNLPGLQQIPTTEAELDVGTSSKELVYTEDTARLYHYDALCDEIYRVPVLIIMSPVARGYILDLAKGQSLIEYLSLPGARCFMLEWMEPRRQHASLSFEDYASRLVGNCVEKVLETSGEPDFDLGWLLHGGHACQHVHSKHSKPGSKEFGMLHDAL